MLDSNSLALLSAAILLAWTVFSLQSRQVDMIASLLHNAAWIVGLALVGSGLLGYRQLSPEAWALILGAIALFNFGVAVASARPGLDRPIKPDPAPRPIVTWRTYTILLAAFGTGFAIYLVTIARNFGIATLVRDPIGIRTGSAGSGTLYLEAFPLYGKVLFYLAPVCVVLTVFGDYVEGMRARSIGRRGLILICLGLAQIATLQRTNLFASLAWVGGLAALRWRQSQQGRRPPSGRKVVAIVAAAGIGLLAFQGLAMALGKTGVENAAVRSALDPRLQGAPYAGMFHYASSGIPAFGELTKSTNSAWPPERSGGRPIYGDYNPQTWGAASFAGPLKLVPGARQWEEVAPFVELPAPTNVYTWLEPWFRDFRHVGALMGPFLVGLLVGRLSRSRHGSTRQLLGGLLIGFAGFATFTNRLTSVMSLVIYAALLALNRLHSRSDDKARVATRESRRLALPA